MKKLTVRSSSSAFLGSGSGLLAAASSTLLHVLIHTTSGFGFFDQSLGNLLVDAEALLNGIVGFVEETGDGLTVDLCEGEVSEDVSREGGGYTYFAAVGGDEGGHEALDGVEILPVSGHDCFGYDNGG